MDQNDDVELLVHITAPGLAADDRRYRSFASAYLDFQPATRQDVFTTHPGRTTSDEAAAQLTTELPRSQVSLLQEIAGLPSFVDSPDISFESAVVSKNQAAKPAAVRTPAGRTKPDRQDGGSQESWVAPPSAIQDSNPDNDVTIPMFNSPTRILEKFLSAMETQTQTRTQVQSQIPGLEEQEAVQSTSSQAHFVIPDTQVEVPSSPPNAPRDEAPSSEVPGTQASFSSALSGVSDSFQMPDPSIRSFSMPPTGSVPQLSIASQNQPSGDSGLGTSTSSMMSKVKAQLTLCRSDSAPPAPKRQKQLSVDDPGRLLLARAESDLAPPITRSQSFLGSGRSLGSVSTMNLLEIAAPSPAISIGNIEPADLVTNGLKKLAKDLDIQRRYRPKEITRSIRPFERGYWSIDCSKWEFELKKDSWTFLQNFVMGGQAGWGIRCCRNEAFTWMRVYCWGYVVGHVYLMVYLASHKKILVTGCSWVSGNGDPVIKMAPKRISNA